jgi:hypothetical protein
MPTSIARLLQGKTMAETKRSAATLLPQAAGDRPGQPSDNPYIGTPVEDIVDVTLDSSVGVDSIHAHSH